MSKWKEYKLKEFAEIQTGPFGSQLHAADYVNIGTPSIMPTNIGNRLNIVTDKIVFVNDKDIDRLKKYTVENTDIVYSRRGDVEKCAYITEAQAGWLCGTGCLRIRFTSKNISPKFCAYYLSTPQIKSWVLNSAVGTTMPNLNTTILGELPLVIPNIYEQKIIEEILTCIDEKTDLLHRQNKTIELLAETIFRQWFVEEAEKSWEKDVLGNLFEIGIGRTPPRKEQHWFSTNPDDVKWVSIKDMGMNGIYIDTTAEYLTQEAVENFSVPVIPENTVMLSFKMTIGRLAISTERMLSNEAIAHFKQKEKSNLFPEFLYLFLKTFRWEQLGSTSSIVEAINSQMIKDMELIIPNEKKLNDFKEQMKPYFEKIKTNQKQIRTLTQLRNTLLPKLMSGEVGVN
jgi:type I restriction enzyme, S subunit